MNLPNGVTVFYSSLDDKPNEIDEQTFKNLYLKLVRKNQGRIINMKELKVITNFYRVKVRIDNQKLYVLLNIYYPLVAFVSVVEFQHLHFIDSPLLSKEFIPFYKVLSKDELNEPLKIRKRKGTITLENKNKLNKTQLEKIFHW
ncbi:hypothetical protein [Priestia filamentosa]|uniref:hypothetical protein n=1 Tax=Priestia filamentosa TaxID=1402861 RepID=UPI003981CB81